MLLTPYESDEFGGLKWKFVNLFASKSYHKQSAKHLIPGYFAISAKRNLTDNLASPPWSSMNKYGWLWCVSESELWRKPTAYAWTWTKKLGDVQRTQQTRQTSCCFPSWYISGNWSYLLALLVSVTRMNRTQFDWCYQSNSFALFSVFLQPLCLWYSRAKTGTMTFVWDSYYSSEKSQLVKTW